MRPRGGWAELTGTYFAQCGTTTGQILGPPVVEKKTKKALGQVPKWWATVQGWAGSRSRGTGYKRPRRASNCSLRLDCLSACLCSFSCALHEPVFRTPSGPSEPSTSLALRQSAASSGAVGDRAHTVPRPDAWDAQEAGQAQVQLRGCAAFPIPGRLTRRSKCPSCVLCR